MRLPSTSTSYQNRILSIVISIAFGCLIAFSFYLQTFKRHHINSDVVEYYGFVGGAFECRDLSFSSGCPENFWPHRTLDGKTVNKRSIGMAYMYTPFYWISQGMAKIQGRNDDGYSRQTQNVLVIGMWIYVCIGLFFLGKSLFQYFNTTTVIIVLFTLLLGTNLIWYTNGEPLFTHGVNFMWLSLLLWGTIRFHQLQNLRWLMLVSFSVSMLTIIRPNNILFAVIPVLYGVYDWESMKARIDLIKKKYVVFILATVVFFIPIIPQLLYWKYASGKWLFYSYGAETFYWLRPMLAEVLFSFRKGWLIYTPVMVLSIIGIVLIRRKIKEWWLPVVVVFPIFLYSISCWWAWSYGGCYGMRPMIDIYPLLALPLGVVVSTQKWWIKFPVYGFMLICSTLNTFQVWQYNKGILHYDQMNWETYKAIWLKTVYPNNYDLLVSYPDYDRELHGKKSFATQKEIADQPCSIRSIRGGNWCTDSLGFIYTDKNKAEAFQFLLDFTTQHFRIRNMHGKFLNLDSTGVLRTGGEDPFEATMYQVKELGYNKFVIQTLQNKFLLVDVQDHSKIKMGSTDPDPVTIVAIRRYVF